MLNNSGVRVIESPWLNTPTCIDILFERLDAVLWEASYLAIDMAAVGFITPAGYLALTLAIQKALATGLAVGLTNVAPQILAYLERLDLPKVAGEGLHIPEGTEHFHRSAASTNLVEIISIPGSYPSHGVVMGQAVKRIYDVIARWYRPGPPTDQLMTIVTELLSNVLHSRDTGYLVVQKYRRNDCDAVYIAVGDLGIGVRQSLSIQPRTMSLTSDLEYLKCATRLHGSRHDGGLGLARVDDLVKNWGGTYSIRSGTARLVVANGQIMPDESLYPVPGTQVEIVVRS